MANLTPAIATEVLAACKAGAAKAAQALSRTFGSTIQLEIGEATTFQPAGLEEAQGAGLMVVLTVGPSAALVLLPESSGLIPDWCAKPDSTGQSKLDGLAQELAVLLPEAYLPGSFKAGRVQSLAGALKRAGVSTGAAVISLKLTGDAGKRGVARLIWPAATPSVIFQETMAPSATPKMPPPNPSEAKAKPNLRAVSSLDDLPGFTRSLLKIKVPVMVTLATKKQPLGQIIELGPGSIIQFEKSCEEMLDMEAAGHRVARGEAVKVGDKFGLRITSVVLPDERFLAVGSKRN